MGYTSYFDILVEELPADKWQLFLADLRLAAQLCKDRGIELSGCHMDKNPVFLDSQVCVNGVGEGAHETFYVERHECFEPTGKRRFAFCKTAHKPYDLFVSLGLIALKNCFGRLVTVSSDGSPNRVYPEMSDEWKAAFAAAKELFRVECSWDAKYNLKVGTTPAKQRRCHGS